MSIRLLLPLCCALAVAAGIAGAGSPDTLALSPHPDSVAVLPPQLCWPPDSAREIGARPLLFWHPAGDTLLYRILIGTDSLFLPPAIEDSVIADTAYRPLHPLQNDSLYYWCVELRDTSGIFRHREMRSFRVAPLPGLTRPALAFGYLPRGDTSRARVSLANPLPRAVAVDSAWSASGRFRVLTPLPAVIDSLDTLELLIAFIPAEFLFIADTLRLRTELGDPALRVTGDSPPPLIVAGREKLGFSPVAFGDTSVQTLILHNRGVVNPLTVRRLKSGLRMIQVSGPVPLLIPPRDSAAIRLRFVPAVVRPPAYGIFLDTLLVESDGGALGIELRAEHPSPRMAVSPGTVDFGSLSVGDSLVRLVTVTSASLNPLRVDSVRVWNSAYRVSAVRRTLRGRDTLAVPVRFLPRRYGLFADSLLLFSNAVLSPMRIALRGNVPPPLLAADQKLLHFGEVPARESARLVVGVSNSSISGLVIDSITTKTRRFRVEQFPQFTALRRGDTLRVGVTFLPDTSLTFRDTLVIYNNSQTPRWRIPLFGTGKEVMSGEGVPGAFALMQNFPNPFTGTTTFRYALPERCSVRLLVYSSLGQVIAVVMEGEQEQGYHNVPWRAETASGMYFYKLIATSLVDSERQYAATKRLMIIR